MSRRITRFLAAGLAAAALGTTLVAADASPHDVVHARKLADAGLVAPGGWPAMSNLACTDGRAGPFPCSNVDLLGYLPLDSIGGGAGNDIWGWTDATNGNEYALVGKSTGVAIVDISEPTFPIWLGDVETETVSSSWRDVKVYEDTMYVVSEAAQHGIQKFDLTQLRGVDTAQDWSADDVAIISGSVHNFVVNEDSGMGYAVGSKLCRGGAIAIDLDRFQPLSADGCTLADGYSHDLQCVVYDGPDQDHVGKEICLGSNEDSLTIYDMTVPVPGTILSKLTYAGAEYTHQGWLTDDGAYFLVGDELDESRGAEGTTTLVFDVSDLDAPTLVGTHVADTKAIDHNMYVTGNVVHQANYRAGYRLLELTDLSTATLTEVAFFDIFPADDGASFNGAWGVYPFFPSGVVIVSGIEQGLFILQPNVAYDVPRPVHRDSLLG